MTIDSLDRNPVQPAGPVALTPADTMLDRLAVLSRWIEAHRTAIYLIETEQREVRAELVRTGWKPPQVSV